MMKQRQRGMGTVVLSLLVLSVSVASVSAQCKLRFDILPANSTFNMTGANQLITGTNVIAGPINEVPSFVKGFQGSVWAIANGLAACPTTEAGWLAALPNITFNTQSNQYWYTPVTAYPPELPASTTGFVYNPRQIAFTMNGTKNGTLTGNSFPLRFAVTLTQGWLYSSTPITGTRYDDLRDYSNENVTTAVLTVEPGTGNTTLVTLSLPRLLVNLTSKPGSIVFPGQSAPWTTITGVYLSGRIVAQAVQGCGVPCGEHGRCVVASSGVPVCQCECGFTQDPTGSCTVPNGWCDQFSGNGNQSVVIQYVPGPPALCPANPPSGAGGTGGDGTGGTTDNKPQSIPPSGGGVCPAGYGINVQQSSCALCGDGWAGPACSMCQSDNACKILSPAAQCVRLAGYQQKSLAKNYTCDLQDPSVSGLLGKTLSFTCSTLPPANASKVLANSVGITGNSGIITTSVPVVGTTPYCMMMFRMPTFVSGAYARCLGWDCKFARDTSKVSCGVVQCDCPGGCLTTTGDDMAPTFKGVAGSIAISCQDPQAGSFAQDCAVDLTGLPIASVQATCTTSECYDENNGAVELGFAQNTTGIQKPKVGDAVIAAIPILVITLIGMLVATSLFIAVPYIKGVPKGARTTTNTSHMGSTHMSGKYPSGPIAEGAETDPRSVELLPARNGSDAVTNGSFGVGSGRMGASGRIGSGAGGAALALTVAPLPEWALAVEEYGNSAGMQFRFMDVTVTARSGSSWLKSCFTRPKADMDLSNGLPPGEKLILQSVSGSAGVGQVVGIMGPSGSGKSTLLNVLCGQVRSGGAWNVSGTFLLGSQALKPDDLVAVTAAVPQHDLLLKFLTVEEALRCSAALRLGPDVSARDAYERVANVLAELNMTHLKDRVGFKGNQALLSGGERQRVSIGMELVTNPQLLLLDEPTSGLDSYNAHQVLKTLQEVASAGRIVITSLHQPSPVLFNMLDRVLLISRGLVVYSGAPSGAEEAFAALGLPCPPDNVIAEHMLEVVGNRETVLPLLERVSQPDFVARVRMAAMIGSGDKENKGGESPQSSSEDKSNNIASAVDVYPPKRMKKEAPAPFLRRLGVLAWRNFTDCGRSPALFFMHLAFGIAIGLIVGFVLFDTQNDTAGAQNRVGGIFFCMNLFAFLGVTALDLLHSERQVVEREMLRRHYQPWLYMGMKVLVDSLLLRALPSGLFSILMYWLMGLRKTAEAFFVFFFVFMTYTCCIGAIALTCAALIPQLGKSLLVFNLLLLNFVLFTGFLVRKSSITWVFRWITYISPMRYTWEALVINELQPIILTLNVDGLPPVPPLQGRIFLSILGVDPDARTVDIIVISCMFAGVALMAMTAMTLRVYLLRIGMSNA